MKIVINIFLFFMLQVAGFSQIIQKYTTANDSIVVAAERVEEYLPYLQNKRVAIVGNQTSVVSNCHLVDTILAHGINIVKVFAPEHGFRGEAANGEKINNGIDSQTGLPIISLYGKDKKPSDKMLENVDVIVFDIQDVGARFYTYISSMHYVMEAAAENNIEVVILDRPNPNGFYVDGPVLDLDYQSFVGMHPIPIVHGMTIAELALMINGEGWLEKAIQCEIHIIPCENYSHKDLYKLPIAPSPNLPNMTSVYLYPSLCLFESTEISVGRGTDFPFQIFGYPKLENGTFSFTPKKIEGVSEYPKFKDENCQGYDLREFGNFYFTNGGGLYLDWLIGIYTNYPDQSSFFNHNNFFDNLAGNKKLRQQITTGVSVQRIKESWDVDISTFKNKRKKYLLYPDFE